jgi:hypothetical protein
MNKENLHWQIFTVARDIYERSGRIEGRDLGNWLEAERIVRTLREIAGGDGQTYIFVNVWMAICVETGFANGNTIAPEI